MDFCAVINTFHHYNVSTFDPNRAYFFRVARFYTQCEIAISFELMATLWHFVFKQCLREPQIASAMVRNRGAIYDTRGFRELMRFSIHH